MQVCKLTVFCIIMIRTLIYSNMLGFVPSCQTDDKKFDVWAFTTRQWLFEPNIMKCFIQFASPKVLPSSLAQCSVVAHATREAIKGALLDQLGWECGWIGSMGKLTTRAWASAGLYVSLTNTCKHTTWHERHKPLKRDRLRGLCKR